MLRAVQMFCCSWTTYLEQLTCQFARQGSQLHRIQKTTENIHVSDGLRRIVTFLIIAPYKCSYLLTYLLNSEKCYHSANFVLSYPVTTTIKGSKDARRHKQGRHPPGKCKGKIRFNYNILVRTDRIKFVATRHVSWVKIFYMCLWRSPYPQLDLMGPFREGRAGRGGEERKMRERKVTEGK